MTPGWQLALLLVVLVIWSAYLESRIPVPEGPACVHCSGEGSWQCYDQYGECAYCGGQG